MKSKKVWIIIAIIIVLAGVGFFFRDSLGALLGQRANAQTRADRENQNTVTIRPAADIAQVSASGNIALAGQQAVALQVEGIVKEVAVEVGDEVATGDLLATLETDDLERAVQRAELSLAASQAALDQLSEPATEADIAAAQASLAAAQESLADLKAGPSDAELAAAQAALAAAQESYQELIDGPSEAELTQLATELHKASITLKQAQEAYNKISYRGDAGSTQQAMDLQTATIDYDTAKAAYEVATAPASQAELEAALQAIKDAQAQLEALTPTAADIAAAEAQVASAEAALASLVNGPTKSELETARLTLAQSQLDLEEAQSNLAQAQLKAPVDGAVLAVNIEVGQQVTSGLSAITLADLTALELTVNVAEVDIPKVRLDQLAQITVDALPDQTFSGGVTRIAPTSASTEGVVNYPVTIRLDDRNLTGVRPGMTAVATLQGETLKTQWLVPTNALQEFEGTTSIEVVRNGQRSRVEVVRGASQGEWTVVQSPDLRAGDQVVGEVTSFVGQENNFGGGGPRGPFIPFR
jgi:HlyD family secretion protein